MANEMYNSTVVGEVGTSLQFVAQTVNGSHKFEINGYSLLTGMGIGKCITSEIFTAGGPQWAICFYPDGKNHNDSAAYVSVFIRLASDDMNVHALFELTLLDQSGSGKHLVLSHFNRSRESVPYTLKNIGSMWGFSHFYKRTDLEWSRFLKDDYLKINCTVGVLMPAIYSSKLKAIEVPVSN